MPRKIRNSTTFGLAVQLMFMVTATRLQLPQELFYIILIALLALQALFFERDNPGERVIDTQQYSFTEAPAQVFAAILITIPIVAPFVILGRRAIPADFLNEAFTQGIFVTFSETVYMIVTVRTLWYQDRNVGLVLWPPIFAFLHPAVRDNWIRGLFPMESFLAFVYAAAFGVFFWILWEGRTRRIFAKRYRRYFGAVTTWTSHLMINLFVIAFPLSVWLLDLFPLVIGHG